MIIILSLFFSRLNTPQQEEKERKKKKQAVGQIRL